MNAFKFTEFVLGTEDQFIVKIYKFIYIYIYMTQVIVVVVAMQVVAAMQNVSVVR